MKSSNIFRILHINATDIKGGAARATYRLHQALLNEGIDSRMLVQMKYSNDNRITGPKNKFEKAISTLRSQIDKFPLDHFYRKKKLISP